MAHPDRPEGARKKSTLIKMTAVELAQIDEVAKKRGVDRSTLVRSVVELSKERDHLMRGILETHVRGRFTANEVSAVLDAMNGCGMAAFSEHYPAMLGAGLALEVHDSRELGEKWEIGQDSLVRGLSDLPPIAKAALDLWCADMWRHCDDDWSAEIAWLAGGEIKS